MYCGHGETVNGRLFTKQKQASRWLCTIFTWDSHRSRTITTTTMGKTGLHMEALTERFRNSRVAFSAVFWRNALSFRAGLLCLCLCLGFYQLLRCSTMLAFCFSVIVAQRRRVAWLFAFNHSICLHKSLSLPLARALLRYTNLIVHTLFSGVSNRKCGCSLSLSLHPCSGATTAVGQKAFEWYICLGIILLCLYIIDRPPNIPLLLQ